MLSRTKHKYSITNNLVAASQMDSKASKVLVAFDFDHTIIDDNSDIYVQKLAPDGIPKEIKQMYSSEGWTEYMAAIFKYLHENGITQDDMLNCMKEIPLVEGMDELFVKLAEDKYHAIIISDSNSVFIDQIMRGYGHEKVINKVYTNPAAFQEDGCLSIEYYHTQDWCDLSTRNLCKGYILEDYIAEQASSGVTFSTVLYVGDGSNDLCPVLKLRKEDFACPRVDFKLEKILAKNQDHEVKAQIAPWETGQEIIDVLNSL